MADVYATITDADPALVTQIAQILELRAADPQQAAMRQTYLGDIAFPDGARVLEVGCGTGAVTRELAGWPSVAEVVGLDRSPTRARRARRRWAGWPSSWPTPADTTHPPRCGSWRATPLAPVPGPAPAVSILVELALVVAGAWLYLRAAVQTSAAAARRANLLGLLILAAGLITLAVDALVA